MFDIFIPIYNIMSRISAEIELQPVIAYPAAVALTTPKDSTTNVSHDAASVRSRGSMDQQPLEPTQTNRSEPPDLGKGKTAVVIAAVTCVTGISALLAGVVTVTLPVMARDLPLEEQLLLWPQSIYALTCGCTLLLLGSLCDVVGNRSMYLLGCALQSAFTLACGLSRSGTQLIIFRAFAGVAISFCLPSAVSIITHSFPPGRRRNVAFASMGGGQPIGFSIGLTIGGVFADTIGWRWGFYLSAILNTVILVVAIWGLPKEIEELDPVTVERLLFDIDWIGALIATTSLAMISFAFASLTGDASNIKNPVTIALLSISIALIPVFIYWCGRQERLGRPAIIPNSLWRNRVFTCICIAVFVTWGTFNAMENLLTFFYQEVEKISAIQTSLRFLPAPASGAIMNILMGLIVHRVRADYAVVIASLVACVAPLLMAFAEPGWNYWGAPFWAIFLNPVGADTLFTISNLLITSVFPAKTQGLAGGVFNTIAQIGKSVGLATSAVVASSITDSSDKADKASPDALLEGYHAAWWYNFALNVFVVLISVWGLRNIGKVGMKRD